MVDWTGLIWLRIGTSGGYCEHGNKSPGSIIVFLDVTHRPVFFLPKTQLFGDWILPISGDRH
jgi:hypothetical protein